MTKGQTFMEFKTNQTCRSLPERQGWAHKWCTPMKPHIWPGKSRTTSTNIHPAAMWGYRVWPWRPAGGDERWGEMAREGQGYPCLRHDMMMIMIFHWPVALSRLQSPNCPTILYLNKLNRLSAQTHSNKISNKFSHHNWIFYLKCMFLPNLPSEQDVR